MIAVVVTLSTATVLAVDNPENEGALGNSTKANANAFTLANGDTISGTSTGTTTAALVTSFDYFRVKTAAAAPGIYLHRMTIVSDPAGHTGTIRGLNQTAGGIGSTDTPVQTSSTSFPDFAIRSNTWYGFGKQEEVYYRIAGAGATVNPYTATLSTTPVTPTVIGPFSAGPIVISTVGQTSGDTELFLYNSTFDPIPGALNDDTQAGGFTINQSQTIRTLSPGTYYLAITSSNTATNEASPASDGNLTGPVMDFPNSLCRSSTATVQQDWDFTVTDVNGTSTFSNQPPLVPHFSYQITFFQFSVIAQSTAPINDNCANAVSIAIGQTRAGTTNLATNDGSASCDPGGAASRDIWYRFDTPVHSGSLTLNTCGSAIDTVLSVYSGTCGSLTEIACNDTCGGSPCGGTASCLSTVVPAGSYYIRVSDKGGAAGEIRITAGFTMNNTEPCNAAVVTSIPFSDVVDNRQSTTASPDPGCTSGTTTAGRFPVWYTYTPAADCTLLVREESTQSVYIQISTGSCGTLTEVHCTSQQSTPFPLTGGTQYWIMVSLTTTTTPTVPMEVLFECVQPPANDTVCNATVINSLPFSEIPDVDAATMDLDVACNIASAPGVWLGVWYRYTPASDCTAAITATFGGSSNVIAVFTGASCSALDSPEIFCSSTTTSTPVSVDFQGGVTYYILIGRSSQSLPALPSSTSFSLNCAPPDPREACSTAESIASLPFFTTVDHSAFAANGPGAPCDNTDTTPPPPPAMQKDVWFSYTHSGADCVARVTVTPTAAYDAVIQVFRGPGCGSLTQIGCFDGEAGSSTVAEQMQIAVTAGETYWIQFGKTGTSATGSAVSNFDIDCAPAPANDLPCNATVLPDLPYFEVVDTSRATHDIWMNDPVTETPTPVNQCGTVAMTNTFYGVWYTYTPTTNCTLIVSENGPTDAVFGIFEGSCGGLNQYACTGSLTQEHMSIGVVGGQQYWILVGTFDISGEPTPPTIPLQVNFECRQPPSNDLPCGAVDLNSTGLPYSESIEVAAATSDPRMTGNCVAGSASLSQNGVWYKYTPAGDCVANIQETSPRNAAIGIYQGLCEDPNEVTCTGNESLSFQMTGGQEYYILVSLGTANPGLSSLDNMNVTISCASNPPANDQVCSATVISSLPFSDVVDNSAATDDIDVSCNAATVFTTKLGVWYTYTPAADCVAQIAEANNQDVVIALFSGPECNNVGEFFCTGNEHIAHPLTGGTQYWILIGSALGNPPVPTQPLSMTFNCVTTPTNDEPCGATVIPGLPFSTSVPLGAANADIDISCNDANALQTHHGTWYQFTPANDCQLKLNESSILNAVWGLFTGPDCSTLTPATPVSCSTSDTAALFNVNAGTTYWILLGLDGAAPAAPGLNMQFSVICTGACITCAGDLNGDSALNGLDIQRFVDCAVAAAGGAPTAGCECSDVVADNVVDSTDVLGMVSLMINPPGCP